MNRSSVRLQGVPVTLFAWKALFFDEKKWLIVADPHFGKAEIFRRKGLPVPAGSTESDLARLSRLLDITEAKGLAILGDLIHAAPEPGSGTIASLKSWRQKHPKLQLLIVPGNHDRQAEHAFEAMGVSRLSDGLETDRFILSHKPPECSGDSRPKYVLAGHVHPALRVPGLKTRGAAFPCFYFGKRYGLLPAFGSFTGSSTVSPSNGEFAFICSKDEIYPLAF